MLGAALWLLLAPVLEGAPPSLPPSLERAATLHGPALVSVLGKDTGARAGFFVSSSGVVVTVAYSDDDVVVELRSGERRRARVLARDEDGLALVEVVKLEKDEELLFPSLGLARTPTVPRAGAWLMGIDVVEGRASPSLGGLRKVEGPRWRLDLPIGAGSPILAGDQVIGVVVERAGTTASVAVSAERITALVKRLSRG